MNRSGSGDVPSVMCQACTVAAGSMFHASRLPVSSQLLLSLGMLGQDVDSKLEAELTKALDQCTQEVDAFMAPVREMTQAQVDRLSEHLSRLEALSGRLEELSMQAASVE